MLRFIILLTLITTPLFAAEPEAARAAVLFQEAKADPAKYALQQSR
jgi:hypothetical protein